MFKSSVIAVHHPCGEFSDCFSKSTNVCDASKNRDDGPLSVISKGCFHFDIGKRMIFHRQGNEKKCTCSSRIRAAVARAKVTMRTRYVANSLDWS